MTATNTRKTKATGRRNAVAFQTISNNSLKSTGVVERQQDGSKDRGRA